MRVAKKRERQGYEMKGPDDHYYTIDPKTNRFLKSKDHPTLHKELDWYYSDAGKEFRDKHKLVTHNKLGKEKKYYRYKKR